MNQRVKVRLDRRETRSVQIGRGVRQGCCFVTNSVQLVQRDLGPLLYLIYTADLPTTDKSYTATFADNTAILTVHEDPDAATQQLQVHLNIIHPWLIEWLMKANETKSTQVNFSQKTDVPTSLPKQ